MSRFFRQLWRIRRLVIIWLILLCISGIHWLRQYAGLETVEDYNELARRAISDVFIATALAGLLFLLYLILRRWRNSQRLYLPNTFENKPWQYDRSVISISGQVTRILPNDWDESLQRRSRNILRLLTKDPETVGRYRHLRFLLSSPTFRRGEQVLIIHNLDSEPLSLEIGDWVEVRGEYIHQRVRRRRFIGARLSTYGKIHYTHAPKGHIRILDGPPPQNNRRKTAGRYIE